MLKRTLGLVIAAVMLLGVFCLTACNYDTLDAYKAEGKTAIETYAEERKGNYCEDNWTAVCGIVETGKQAVDAAENKEGVDTAISNAKDAIDDVAEEGLGMFFTLQEAYDKGWLTMQDLQSIAYYQGSLGGINGTFIPTLKDPIHLSEEVVTKIKKLYTSILLSKTYPNGTPLFPNATTDCVTIEEYYGTYNDAVALKITDVYTEYGASIEEIKVGGITFGYSGAPITIWR